jgi:hypothetical protein
MCETTVIMMAPPRMFPNSRKEMETTFVAVILQVGDYALFPNRVATRGT